MSDMLPEPGSYVDPSQVYGSGDQYFMGPTLPITSNRPVPLDTGFGSPDIAQVPVASANDPQGFNTVETLHGMSPAQVNFWQQALIVHGYMSPKDANWNGMWTGDGVTAFQQAVQDANYNRVPIGTYLWYDPKKAAATTPTSTSSSSSHSVSTSTSTNLSTRSQARAVLTNALTQELGREPTANEVGAFLNLLNADERRHASTSTSVNDSTSTSTSTRNATGGSDSTSTSNSTSNSNSTSYTSSPQEMAIQYARKNDRAEWKRYQSGRYMNVLDQLMGL